MYITSKRSLKLSWQFCGHVNFAWNDSIYWVCISWDVKRNNKFSPHMRLRFERTKILLTIDSGLSLPFNFVGHCRREESCSCLAFFVTIESHWLILFNKKTILQNSVDFHIEILSEENYLKKGFVRADL